MMARLQQRAARFLTAMFDLHARSHPRAYYESHIPHRWWRPVKAIIAGTLATLTLLGGTIQARADDGVITVPLRSVNGFGQSGVATLTPTTNGYTVAVRLTGRTVRLGEHDHIHNLSCARYARIAPHPKTPTAAQIAKQLATVTVGLNDIDKGRSRTVVTTPLSDITTGGYSINVHEPTNPYTALACGDIPAR